MGTIINAGKLNKRITFFVYAEENEEDGRVQTKKAVRSCWAKIKTTRSYENSVEEKLNGEFVYTILVRYFKNLTLDMLIEYKGEILEITQINNIDEGNYAYEIVAKNRVYKKGDEDFF